MVINTLHSVDPTDTDGCLAAHIFETGCLEGLAVMCVVLWKFVRGTVAAFEDPVNVFSQTREWKCSINWGEEVCSWESNLSLVSFEADTNLFLQIPKWAGLVQ